MNRHIAVQTVEFQAQKSEATDVNQFKHLLDESNLEADIEQLKDQLLYACDVTINFHPDRFSNNGQLIINNLLHEGQYYNQYKTGTSNGAGQHI